MNLLEGIDSQCRSCDEEASASQTGMPTSESSDSVCTAQGCALHGSLTADRCKEGGRLLEANAVLRSYQKLQKFDRASPGLNPVRCAPLRAVQECLTRTG